MLNLNFNFMRPRIFSLLLVLSVILIAPTVIVSCDQANAAQKEHVYLADAGTQTQINQLAPDQAEIEYTATPTTQDGLSQIISQDADVFSWQNITVLVLGILSTIFAVLWKRASKVIQAISDSLQDGKIDKNELQRIIAAWKG